MEVVLAESAGFCFGVKRAVDTVYEEIEKGGIIYTFGPIIHNKEVVNDFLKKGVKEIKGLRVCNLIDGVSITKAILNVAYIITIILMFILIFQLLGMSLLSGNIHYQSFLNAFFFRLLLIL